MANEFSSFDVCGAGIDADINGVGSCCAGAGRCTRGCTPAAQDIPELLRSVQ